MGARRSGREAALQMLFALEASNPSVEEVTAHFWRHFDGEPEGRSYADALVAGVAGEIEALDASIRTASTNWRLERMSRVDRNLLRLGAYELRFRPDVPRAVILNEAVEMAKEFGTEESGSFVNGVLARIADELGRRDNDSGATPAS